MSADPHDVMGNAAHAAMYGSRDADKLLADLRTLRRSIILAWQERSVMLTRAEQQELRNEIRETCELLTSLTE